MNTTNIFQLGQLAEAAYGNFVFEDGALITLDTNVQNILQGLNPDGTKNPDNSMAFSQTQALLFTEQWSVIAHQPNTSSGFSATLFQNKETGEQVYATRGTDGMRFTDPSSWIEFGIDLVSDLGGIVKNGLAVDQIVDMYNDWQRINSPVGAYDIKVLQFEPLLSLTLGGLQLDELLASGYYIYESASGAIYSIKDSRSDIEYGANDPRATGAGEVNYGVASATGHSLGGHLAFAFSRLFGVEGIGINGAGISEGSIENHNINNLFQMLAGSFTSFSAANTNIYGELGPEASAQTDGPILFQPGGTSPLFIEDAVGNTLGHGKEQMTDSLAVADLFIQLSPDLQGSDITAVLGQVKKLIEVSGNNRPLSLENTATHLGTLLEIDKSLLNPDQDNREDLYQLIDAIKKSPSFLQLQQGGVTFEVLSADAGQLAGEAKTSDAVRYSLATLTPFILTGSAADALYASHADEIKLFDADLDEGGMTDKYLEDRAKMLAVMITRNINDAILAGDTTDTYEDLASGQVISNAYMINRDIDKSQNQQFIFGNNSSNLLSGGELDDSLYGAEGDDIIDGGKGADYMEGGAGSDTYRATDGDEILDTDTKGKIILDGATLKGGSKETGSTSWVGADEKTTYSLENGVLTVVTDKSTIKIHNFESGNLGIDLIDKPDDPRIDKTYSGETWIAGTSIVRNFVTETLYLDAYGFSADNDKVEVPESWAGAMLSLYGGAGDDQLKTANGKETLNGQEGKDILQGGADSDILYGGAGDDLLYAETKEIANIEKLFDPDEVATDQSRDFLQGGAGDDQLYGSAGSNFLDGGGGKDLIAAGAGNDVIYGDSLYLLQPDIDRVDEFSDGNGQWTDKNGWYETQFEWSVTKQGNQYQNSKHILNTAPLLGFVDGLPANEQDDDVIYAGAGDDVVFSQGGNDVVLAGIGNDFVNGGDGADVIMGGSGDDTLFGDTEKSLQPGNDALFGDDGSDKLVGAQGDDNLSGGKGDDILLGDADFVKDDQHGNDTLDGGEGADQLWGYGKDDHLIGGAGDDQLIGDHTTQQVAVELHGNDWLEGGAGEDKLWGNGGNDVLYGGADNDFLQGDADDVEGDKKGNDQLYGEAGNDSLIGDGGNDLLSGGDGDDILHGDSTTTDGAYHGSDTLYGGDGADSLTGGGESDSLFGGEGNDTLSGDDAALNEAYHGNDVLFGEGGDDSLYGNAGNDLLSGGNGVDTLSGGAGNDTLSGDDDNDTLYGGDGDDRLLGGAGNDLLYANDGDDVLSGGDGDDTLSGGAGSDRVSGDDGVDTVYGDDGNDLLSGGAGDDFLYGNNDDDVLDGGAGFDHLYGGAGDDTLSGGAGSGDILDGGEGNDSYLFGLGNGDTTIWNHESGVGNDVLRFQSGIAPGDVKVYRSGNHLGLELMTSLETVFVGDFFNGAELDAIEFSDATRWDAQTLKQMVLQPSEVDDLFSGYASADVIFGAGGNDTLYGMDGDDTLDGGDGNDIAYGGAGHDVINGGSGNDSLFGDGGDDTLSGGTGFDTLNGGAGNDHYLYAPGDGNITINNNDSAAGRQDVLRFLAGISSNDVIASRSDVSLILTLQGSGEVITLNNHFHTSNSGINLIEFSDGVVWDQAALEAMLLQATTGDDRLYGYAGDDLIDGLAGNDYLFGADGNDTLNGNDGNDRLYGDAGNDLLNGGTGRDILYGGDGDDTLSGGNGVNDILSGDEGSDTYLFAAGDGDTTIKNFDWSMNRQDVLRFTGAIGGQDVVVSRSDDDLLLTLTSSGEVIQVKDHFFSQDYAINRIEFSDGTVWDAATINARLLLATEANDNLFGTQADETIDALAGDDYISGGGGADILIGGAGHDYIEGDAGNDLISGNGGDDWLDGGDGNDSLHGGSGSDKIFGGAGDDELRGEGGLDTLSGDAGNDVYLFAVGDGDTLIENYESSSGYADVLRFMPGISSNEVVATRSGNHLLLTIGASAEVITVVRHFEVNYNGESNYTLEGIEFSDGTVWNQAAINTLVLQPTAGADVLYGSDNADTLSGLAGDDRLYGGNGNDTLKGDDGNDQLYGQSGDDYVSGDAGDDWVYGEAGNDTLQGGAGKDRLFAGSGDDVLSGGTGDDFLSGDQGSDVYLYTSGDGNTTIDNYDSSSARHDVLRFLPGISMADIALSRSSNDLLITLLASGEVITLLRHFEVSGNSANDSAINAIEFSDGSALDSASINLLVAAVASDGNDTLTLSALDDHLNALGGDDVLYGGDGNDSLNGGDGTDRLFGQNGDDVLYGDAGDDVLYGDAGNDTLDGGAGSDSLSGGSGDDVLKGGAGVDDHLSGDAGNDVYVFAAGDGNTTISNFDAALTRNDVLRFENGITTDDVAATRRDHNLILTLKATGEIITVSDHFYITENPRPNQHAIDAIQFSDGTVWDEQQLQTLVKTATNGNDILYGDYEDDVIDGLAGDDILSGGYGNDVLDGAEGNDKIYGGNAEELTYSGGYNSWAWSPGHDILNGGSGNDELYGGYGNDTLHGGSGTDWLYGGYGDDALTGGDGNDYLYGENGNDTLRGGGGSFNTLNGGFGNDRYLFAAGDGDTVIHNHDSEIGRYDALHFMEGLTADDIQVSRSSNSLLLSISQTGETITLTDFFSASENEINAIEFADGTQWDSDTIKILAAGGQTVNHSPELSSMISDQQTLEDMPFSFNIPADAFTDVDAGDTLSYSATLSDDSALPAWLDFDAATQTFSGTPTNNEVGALAVKVTASDGSSSVSDIFTLDVINYNDAPVLVSALSDQQTLEDVPFSFNIPADAFTDVDAGDTLSYSATLSDDSALPAWLDFDAATQTFSGTPGNSEVGTLAVKVTASDGHRHVSDEFTLTVTNTNDAPMVTAALIDQQLTENHSFDFNLPANSFSDTDINDILNYSALMSDGSALPDWLSFNAETRTFSGTPRSGFVGELEVVVTATDSIGLSVSNSFRLSVISDKNFIAGSHLNDRITGSDGIDSIDGLAGDDRIYGADGNDELAGGDGNDQVYGETGDDHLSGGTGNDRLYGGEGHDVLAAGADNDYLNGNAGDDRLSGEVGDDRLYGEDGIDLLDGGAGNDRLYGGNGDDQLLGAEGDDRLSGDAGNDVLDGGAGSDRLYGGEGHDVLAAGADNDYLNGNAGDDQLSGEAGDDRLYGEVGIDLLDGGTGNDRLYGGNGDDQLFGAEGDDRLSGDAGNDVLDGGAGSDRLYGGEGHDVLAAGADNDYLNGNAGDDQLSGEAGDDRLYGEDGIDLLDGGAGNDFLKGGNGDDVMSGGLDDDRIYGEAGDDLLEGGSGNDRLYGGEGNDRLSGLSGDDFLDGGDGNDTYLFERGSGLDTLSNFESGGMGMDVAIFQDANFEDLWFSKSRSHLMISVTGTEDSVVIRNWFKGADYQLDSFEAGSSVLLNNQIDQLVLAMASFNVPVGAGSVIPSHVKDELATVLAQTWQAA